MGAAAAPAAPVAAPVAVAVAVAVAAPAAVVVAVVVVVVVVVLLLLLLPLGPFLVLALVPLSMSVSTFELASCEFYLQTSGIFCGCGFS